MDTGPSRPVLLPAYQAEPPVLDGQLQISLGYFTQEPLAARFVAHLHSLDINARAEPDYERLGPYHWLEVPMPAAGPAELRALDWPAPPPDVSPADC